MEARKNEREINQNELFFLFRLATIGMIEGVDNSIGSFVFNSDHLEHYSKIYARFLSSHKNLRIVNESCITIRDLLNTVIEDGEIRKEFVRKIAVFVNKMEVKLTLISLNGEDRINKLLLKQLFVLYNSVEIIKILDRSGYEDFKLIDDLKETMHKLILNISTFLDQSGKDSDSGEYNLLDGVKYSITQVLDYLTIFKLIYLPDVS